MNARLFGAAGPTSNVMLGLTPTKQSHDIIDKRLAYGTEESVSVCGHG
jgi:hypothetical protein